MCPRPPVLLVAASLLLACRPPAPREPAPAAAPPQDLASSWRRAGDALWPERGDPDRLEAALARYAQAWEAGPPDPTLALRLARGWLFAALAHRIDDPEARREALSQARRWARRCLPPAALAEDETLEQVRLAAIEPDDAACLFMAARVLDAETHLAGEARSASRHAVVEPMFRRVLALAPATFAYGPDRVLGAHLATLPAFGGRDLEAARRHLDTARGEAPEYVENTVLTAESWAVRARDRAAFRALLEEALDAPDAAEYAPENAVARARARALLAAEERVFGPDGILMTPIEGAPLRFE